MPGTALVSPDMSQKQKAKLRNVQIQAGVVTIPEQAGAGGPALPLAELGSHPGFTAGVLVPASRGEELSAFQVCIKPSNLSSHGGVIKAVPTKQNEQSCFPRPGESLLGSGKILFPRAGARAVSDALSPALPSVGQCHTFLLCVTGGWKARSHGGRGLHHAGVLRAVEHCCLGSARFPCAPARGCSHAGEEPFPSTAGYFWFTDLVCAANGCLSLQREFTKAGRWVTANRVSG